MTEFRRFALALVIAAVLPVAVTYAQRPQVSTVNITPEEGRVRVAAEGSVFDLKIEVTDEAGETVFEGSQISGRPLDWEMVDADGRRVRPGEYTVLVSYRTQAGKLRRRVEQVLVTEEVAGAEEKAGGQKSSASGAPNPEPLLDGSGAANRIPKFTDADTFTSSSIMDVGGNISVGKNTAPAAGLRLEINGATRLTPGGTGGYMQFGTPNGETGLSWSKGTTSRADFRFNGSAVTLAAVTGANVPPATNGLAVTTAGRVGIGTLTPTSGKLHVLGLAGVPAVYGESPNRGVWGKSTGASYGVYGESASGIGVEGKSATNFGVTGHTGAACCAVAGVYGNSTHAGGLGVMGQGGAAGVHGVSGAGTGVHGKSTSQWGVYGQSTSNVGVHGRTNTTSTGGAGVAGYNDAGGWAMYAGGNAGQQRDRGGWVKAMVYVQGNPIKNIRCFNSQMPAGGNATDKCGIGMHIFYIDNNIQYIIEFPFKVSDRFVSVTPQRSGTVNAGANFEFSGENTIVVRLFNAGEPTDNTRASFMLIVF